MIYGDLYWLEWAETCTDERLCEMKANKCEEYCGNCFPLTITVDGRQYVYRYGSAKQRTVGLGQLRYIYKGKHITPVYACAMIAPIREEMEGGQNDS